MGISGGCSKRVREEYEGKGPGKGVEVQMKGWRNSGRRAKEAGKGLRKGLEMVESNGRL